MKIAVLDYSTGTVDIVVVDKSFAHDNFDDDTERYLDSLGYHLSNIEWMCDTKGINIIDEDERLQIS